MCFHVHVVFSVAPSISIFKYWINLTWQEQTWDEWLEQASSDHRPKSWKPIEPMKKAQLTAKKRLDAKLQNMKKPAAAKPKAKAKSSSSKTPAAKSKAKGSVAKGNWKKEKKNKKVDKKKTRRLIRRTRRSSKLRRLVRGSAGMLRLNMGLPSVCSENSSLGRRKILRSAGVSLTLASGS